MSDNEQLNAGPKDTQKEGGFFDEWFEYVADAINKIGAGTKIAVASGAAMTGVAATTPAEAQLFGQHLPPPGMREQLSQRETTLYAATNLMLPFLKDFILSEKPAAVKARAEFLKFPTGGKANPNLWTTPVVILKSRVPAATWATFGIPDNFTMVEVSFSRRT